MKINKVNEYILDDDNGNTLRVKFDDDSWNIVIEDDIVFSFEAEDSINLENIFKEIYMSRSDDDIDDDVIKNA
tara:strand:+ start:777 stop:995 length:219 start_codon:yes stop_codon:yes gene_type:complete